MTEMIRDIFLELGGGDRPWHPLDPAVTDTIDYPTERPQNIRDDWKRPDLENYTEDIGRSVEEYLETTYQMERVDEGEVDLLVTDGQMEGTEVQSKGSIFLASQGPDGKGGYYSRPGGIYVRDTGLGELPRDALLHSVVHLPRFEWDSDISVPVIKISDGEEDREHVETALVGELVLPVGKVQDEISYDSDGTYYWDWEDAYGEEPDDEGIEERWYSGSFLEDL